MLVVPTLVLKLVTRVVGISGLVVLPSIRTGVPIVLVVVGTLADRPLRKSIVFVSLLRLVWVTLSMAVLLK